MTISTTTRTAGPFTGTGAIVAYPFAFKTLLAADITVTTVSALDVLSTLVLGTDYSVSLNADQDVSPGGTVTPVVALEVDATLSITTSAAATQGASLTNAGGFFPKVIEGALDRLTILIQQILSGASRLTGVLQYPVGDLASSSVPAAASRASKLLGFDADGNVAVVTPNSQDAAALALQLASAGTSTGAGQVAFIAAGTGAVPRTMQEKGRESVSVLDYGATGDGTTDDTAAFVAAFVASDAVYAPAPAVSYRLSGFTMTDGQCLRTDGFATLLHQISGTAVGTHIIDVAGSNVTIESLSLKGNIATDTSEQNHGIFIRKTGATISNITIGDVMGEDIRGDVLYIGGESAFASRWVRFGRIVGKNILRNVVAIVGGQYITGDAVITDTSTGYRTMDIEPNTTVCHNISVGYVKGGVFQCAPPTSAFSAYSIHVGMLDLDPAFAANSTPAYGTYEPEIAVVLRNTIDIQMDHIRINGHSELGIQYIWNGGEQRGQSINIGYLKVSGVGASETTYNAVIVASAVDSITIEDASVALQAIGDAVILGDSSGVTYTRAVINRLVVDGTVARYIHQGRFTNILINTANVAAAFNRCYDSTIMDSEITIPTLLSFCDRLGLVNVNATCSTAYYGSSVSDITRIGCNFGGNVVPFATSRAAAAGQTGETVIGGTTATTVGAAGGASALPATPLGYVIAYVAGTQVKLPYYSV